MLTASRPPLATSLVSSRGTLVQQIRREQSFLLVCAGGLLVALATFPFPGVARWVGFLLAAYAVVANDSIQTVGTFLASNRARPWWVLWLYIGGLFVLTVTYGWFAYDGDVSFARLSSKGFTEAPRTFSYLQVAAPVVLLVLTRLRMPVSTTFLILGCFSTSWSGIEGVLVKSVAGYGVAFTLAGGVWLLLARPMERWFTGTPSALWMPLQWLSTGFLWVTWIMQDAANIAVFLPRQLSPGAFIAFTACIFLGLGVLFRARGDRMQRVVEEKTDVLDVRPATVIDFVYALILFAFTYTSTIPMSTTWVFVGLLAGRELAIQIRRHRHVPGATWRLVGRDLAAAAIGLAVSVLLALAANPAVFSGEG